MPSYRHKETGKKFHRIHIPRTGGRFFDANLRMNGWEMQYSTQEVVENVETLHFHRALYEKHVPNIKEMPHITIIRNPIDRFISSSIFLKKMYPAHVMDSMENPIMFDMILLDENAPYKDSIQWFRPQFEFISVATNIWKFESGLGEDFGEWVSDIVGVPFPIHKVDYQPLEFLNERDRLERTPKLIDNIRRFYHADFKLFYPDQ